MAFFSECRQLCAQTVLDTADIVRDGDVSTVTQRVLSYWGDGTARPVHEMTSASPMATFSAHTASPPPPSRTPAGLRASSRHASIAPRTTSAHGPLAWAAPRTRTHRSIPAPPPPAGASRLPRTVPYPTPA